MSANAAQIEAWGDAVGKTWVHFQEQLDRQLEPIGRAAMEAAGVRPGERALDIGCGAGSTSLALADLGAEVTGIDISAPLLEVARRRAPEIAWLEADAQVHGFEPESFDVLYSRFGVMFFDDPVAAFANLRAATRPGGRLAFACWREMDVNPWLTLPLRAAAHVVPPQPPVEPGAPGPFAFADPVRVRSILEGAGWSKVAIEPLDILINGGSLDEISRLMTRVGPLGSALRLAEADDAVKAAAEAAVRAAVASFLTADQGVLLPSATWIATAHSQAE